MISARRRRSAFVLAAIFAPLVAPYSPDETDFDGDPRRPVRASTCSARTSSAATSSRAIVWGARASIQAGVLATVLAMAVAVPLGLIAGYFRGWLDAVDRAGHRRAARVPVPDPRGRARRDPRALAPERDDRDRDRADSAGLIRIARGETLPLQEEDYVARRSPTAPTTPSIIGRHILPNMTSTLIVQATVTIPAAIIGEAVLSFLGLGVQPPTPSWGVMLSAAQPYLNEAREPRRVSRASRSHLLALAFNLLGDGLRDVLDPRTRR